MQSRRPDAPPVRDLCVIHAGVWFGKEDGAAIATAALRIVSAAVKHTTSPAIQIIQK